MRIRKTKISDIKSTIEISKITWLNTYVNEDFGIKKQDIINHFLQKEEDGKVEKLERKIKQNSDNSFYFVCEIEKKVVAFSVGYINYGKNKENVLGAIYVLPEYQWKGIGTKLLDEIFKKFKKDDELFLDVVSYNSKTIEFYKSFDFNIINGSESKHDIGNEKFLPTIKMKKIF